MSRRVLKWTVPVDDEQHRVAPGIVHVECLPGEYEQVYVWTLTNDHQGIDTGPLVQIFGTGQPVPDAARYLATTLAMDGKLVWHLFDVTDVKNGS